jgi:uncharacterized protein YjbJ (UPF0337 family)
MSGTTDKIKGTVRETIGKVTGNKHTETEGKMDKAQGNVKDAVDEAAEAARKVNEATRPR